jgi:hypothetical protein
MAEPILLSSISYSFIGLISVHYLKWLNCHTFADYIHVREQTLGESIIGRYIRNPIGAETLALKVNHQE